VAGDGADRRHPARAISHSNGVTVIGILLVRSDLRIERERRKKPPEPPDEFFSLYEWLNSKAAGKDP
jgi:hypothetical protein